MPNLNYRGAPLEVNDAGFLVHPEAWDREMAAFLALESEGVTELGKHHWAVIDYIRGFWEQHRIAPLIRNICRITGLKLKYIYELFPSGPAQGACKVAGLPGPDGCI